MADQDENSTSVIGPALPPHLMKKTEEDSLEIQEESQNEEKSAIGPALPPHLLKKTEEDSLEIEEDSQNEENSAIGPALPPDLSVKSDEESFLIEQRNAEEESFIMGPALPPHMLKKYPQKGNERIGHQPCNKRPEEYACMGPYIPSHLRQRLQEESAVSSKLEEQEDEEIYGPLPVGETSYSKAQLALEERALQLKMDQLDPQQSKSTVREEWMLELPEVKAAGLGLGPRQFRSKAGPDFSDRSSWTDTPNKKAKKEEKVDLKKEAELKEIRKRDEEQAKISKKHKKKNKESLLELHQNELKKKKKDDGEPVERRPFSRDVDLQVNRFDEAQKKAILKKAQLLDDRFSSGQSKFL